MNIHWSVALMLWPLPVVKCFLDSLGIFGYQIASLKLNWMFREKEPCNTDMQWKSGWAEWMFQAFLWASLSHLIILPVCLNVLRWGPTGWECALQRYPLIIDPTKNNVDYKKNLKFKTNEQVSMGSAAGTGLWIFTGICTEEVKVTNHVVHCLWFPQQSSSVCAH